MRRTLNTQARLERALRNNYTVQTVWHTFRTFKWFTLALVTLLPIYPSLSVLGSNLETQVGDYDDSTIITAYQGDILENSSLAVSEDGLIQTEDEDFTVDTETETETVAVASVSPAQKTNANTPIPPKPKSIVAYTVKAGDSLSKISTQYGVSKDSIMWANDMTSDALKPGMTLRIPPVSGVVYTVKKNDTLSDISARYDVDVDDIVRVNNLANAGSISIGKDLVIPGAVKKSEAKKIVSAPIAATQSKQEKIIPTSAAVPAVVNGLKERYAIEYTGKSRGFAWGNCTWFVAQHKTVTWRGNANQWMKNAKAAGAKTGQTPVPGAIIQLSGAGYNRYYGHVAIVMEVQEDEIIIKDMNYRSLNEVTIRKIPKNDSAIDGYIYVD